MSVRLCALLLLAFPVLAQDLELPFERTELFLLVDAEVAGQKVVLAVDTAAALSHLDARYLKLSRSRRTLETIGINGATRLAVLEPAPLLLGGREFRLTAVDADLRNLRKACACKLAGLIGLDLLGTFDVVRFDFRARVLTLHRNN